MNGLVIDNFAGGGGASTGIEAAIGRPIDVAINHDPEAVAMHAANHPGTKHYCQSVWAADPLEVTGGRPVALAWFSPDCKHFSKAKGGKPVEKEIRDLAWVAVEWAQRVKPAVIMLENVEEFRTWGPLTAEHKPCPLGRGLEFKRWVRELEKAGYVVEHRELRACDYGAPTSRKRLFLIARSDGLPIVWPEPTHGPADSLAVRSGQLKPYRTAAEVIDWSIACPSIFERARPLKDATNRRIAAGLVRFVLDAARPFIVPVTHTKGGNRARSVDEPLATITTAKGGEFALTTPFFTRTAHGEVDKSGKRRGKGSHAVDESFPTVTASRDSALVEIDLEKTGRVAAFLEKYRTGSRGASMAAPMPTVTANSFIKRPGGAAPMAVIAAHIEQANTGMVGHPIEKPLSTIVGKGCTQRLIASSLVKLRGTCRDGQPVDEPLHTVSAGGTHFGEVRAFLTKYYGTAEHGQPADRPIDALTAKARFGLVTVTIDGEEYAVSDIGLRMLTPRELARAQGFPDSYILDPIVNGKPLTKTSQIRMIGNSVCPDMAEALVAANVTGATCQAVAA